MNPNDELLPCPFCGVKPDEDRHIEHGKDCYLGYILASNDDAPIVWEDFVIEWNTRYTPQPSADSGMKSAEDTKRLDFIESLIKPGGDEYCEVYLSGLRWPVRPNMSNESFTMSEAQMYQFETNPDKVPTVHANTLREVIDKAIAAGVLSTKEKGE